MSNFVSLVRQRLHALLTRDPHYHDCGARFASDAKFYHTGTNVFRTNHGRLRCVLLFRDRHGVGAEKTLRSVSRVELTPCTRRVCLLRFG